MVEESSGGAGQSAISMLPANRSAASSGNSRLEVRPVPASVYVRPTTERSG